MDIFPAWVGWAVAIVLLVILLAVVTSDWWRNRGDGSDDNRVLTYLAHQVGPRRERS